MADHRTQSATLKAAAHALEYDNDSERFRAKPGTHGLETSQ
jgi:hypothetical protein